MLKFFRVWTTRLTCATLEVHQTQNHRREDELHGNAHLAAGHDQGVGAAHPRVVEHGQQVGKIDALGVREADDHHALVERGNVFGDEGVGGIDRGHALEVDVGARELRRDVMHIVGHAAQDGVHHRFLRVAALDLVAVQLLNPLQVDDGHHAHQQVHLLGHVDLARGVTAVQTFVEHQIGTRLDVLPIGEVARLDAEFGRLARIVDVLAHLAAAGLAVGLEHGFQFAQQIGVGAEVAEVTVARGFLLFHLLAHFHAVELMEGISLDDLRGELFAAEDVLEAAHHRGGAGARRPGDGNDGMFDRHGASLFSRQGNQCMQRPS